MNVKDFIPSLIIGGALVVGLVFGVKAPQVSVTTPPVSVNVPASQPVVNVQPSTQQPAVVNVQSPDQPLGASNGTEHYNTENFYGGLSFGSLSNSSATPAALGTGLYGYFSATSTSQAASTTAVGVNSVVIVTPASSTPISGLTCNSSAATSTKVAIVASSTAPSNNGFIVSYGSQPSGSVTPFCFNYLVLNPHNR